MNLPNKAPEPTITAVTIRAPSSTARASRDRGSSLTLARKLRTRVSSFISIGCQSGGPDAGIVGRAKVPLYQALARNLTSTHCPAIDEFALILRVDGSLDKFGAEGYSNLRFERKRRYIKLDVQIPESSWKPLSEAELKKYLVKRLKGAISLCIARLQDEKLSVETSALESEIASASHEYLASGGSTSLNAKKG